MKKIVTLGATTLTALTLLGAAQPLAHASQNHITPSQIHSKLTSVHTKAATDVVNIPDVALKTFLNNKIDSSRPATHDITEGELTTYITAQKYNLLDLSNQVNIKDLTGIEHMIGVKILQLQGTGVGDNVNNVASISTLTTLAANYSGVTNVNGFTNTSATDIQLKGNKITDLTPLQTIAATGFTGSTTFAAQEINEDPVTWKDGEVTVPIKDVKNIDGSTPTFTFRDGGKLNGTNVTWDRLASTTNKVTYVWNSTTSNRVFSGTVTVPVTWASDEDKVQADVNLLFKDNTRTELNTGVTVQKIEDVRKEANALTDSAKKTELLGQIGDAYGMYFIVNAQAMKAGDPLGDKVKADANMKTLHDFMEAATDFEADMTKAKTSKAAAGTYDYVRSGWSKAVATAQACVNAYVPGTDLSQAGLGDFSTDVANLNTAANAIQGDQNDVTNDKVEVEYNYTAQAPGEPGWYGVVPSAVTLTDANRGTGEVANVELKNATQVGGHYMPYDGGKTVEVSVKSNNSYMLDDGKGDSPVAYKLNFVDGTGTHDVAQDASEHKIGEMKAGDTTIVSHIDLVGNATKSGRYVDNLFYHFSEK